MIIVCPACATRYAVPDSAIGVEGRTVRCAKCRNNWFQEGPSAEELAASADAIVPAGAEPLSAPRAEGEASRPPMPAGGAAAEMAPPTVSLVADAPENSLVARYPRYPEPEAAAAESAPVQPDAPASGGVAEAVAAEPARIASVPPRLAPDAVAASHAEDRGEDDQPSQFEHAPPFRPRRNWARIGTYAAAVFAVVTLTLTGMVAWAGLPSWVPIPRPTFAQAQSDLVLDFPPKRQDRRTLPNGTEFFGASGTVSNVGAQTRYVPTILIVLRDSHDRIVYTWEVVPPKRRLAPGETITINEAVTDVPKSATAAEIGWKPA